MPAAPPPGAPSAPRLRGPRPPNPGSRPASHRSGDRAEGCSAHARAHAHFRCSVLMLARRSDPMGVSVSVSVRVEEAGWASERLRVWLCTLESGWARGGPNQGDEAQFEGWGGGRFRSLQGVLHAFLFNAMLAGLATAILDRAAVVQKAQAHWAATLGSASWEGGRKGRRRRVPLLHERRGPELLELAVDGERALGTAV